MTDKFEKAINDHRTMGYRYGHFGRNDSMLADMDKIIKLFIAQAEGLYLRDNDINFNEYADYLILTILNLLSAPVMNLMPLDSLQLKRALWINEFTKALSKKFAYDFEYLSDKKKLDGLELRIVKIEATDDHYIGFRHERQKTIQTTDGIKHCGVFRRK